MLDHWNSAAAAPGNLRCGDLFELALMVILVSLLVTFQSITESSYCSKEINTENKDSVLRGLKINWESTGSRFFLVPLPRCCELRAWWNRPSNFVVSVCPCAVGVWCVGCGERRVGCVFNRRQYMHRCTYGVLYCEKLMTYAYVFILDAHFHFCICMSEIGTGSRHAAPSFFSFIVVVLSL